MGGGAPYPGGVPRSINYPEIPLYAFLENSARKYPDRPAAIFYGRRHSYGSLWEQALRLAGALRRLGVEKGDRVALLLPNVPQFIVSYNAVLALGATVVAVSPLNPPEEIWRELEETEAQTLIALDRLVDRLPEETPGDLIIADAAAYAPPHLRLLDRLKGGGARSPQGSQGFEGLLRGPALEALVEVEPGEDLAAIQYTGGTTGPPRGVMLTHRNLVANALQSYSWLRGWGYSAKPQPAGWPVVVCAVPFFHIYGMTVAMNETLQFGCTLVLVPDPRPEAIMEAVQRHRATHLPLIPRMMREMLEHPDSARYDLKSLTSCVSGGSAAEPAIVERFEEKTGARIYHGYGLTEAGPTTHCTPLEGAPDHSTVGLPFPDTEARIVDARTGEIELPPGEKGELIVRGPQVMAGYWRRPEETRRALRDGWLYTGDIALVDNDGFLYIVDRKMNRIISAGHTVWPSRVEEALSAHPAVQMAAALGVPDPLRCATDLRALVVLRPGHSVSVEDLMDHCRGSLEPHEVPARIDVVPSLPLSPLGKLDRRALQGILDGLQASRRS
jgi:long-chain acyl-CoA synthetase